MCKHSRIYRLCFKSLTDMLLDTYLKKDIACLLIKYGLYFRES